MDFHQVIATMIQQHRRHLCSIFGGEHKFAYTIGNYEIGYPELLIIGNWPDEIVGGLLNVLSDMMLDKAKTFKSGELVDVGLGLPVKVLDASPAAREDYTCMVGDYYKTEDYAVQQVLLADREGLFPDDPACAPAFRVPIV